MKSLARIAPPFVGLLLPLALLLTGCSTNADPAADSPGRVSEDVASGADDGLDSATGDSPDAAPAAQDTSPPDDAAAVAALEEAGAKLKRDDQGYVVEVDFQPATFDPVLLDHLAKLPKIRSVLLAGYVEDEHLAKLGEITTLQNIDLRDAPISNAGLAHLTGLENLKALRLSGKNGSTTVDDEGMAEVAKLKNLKLLALDFLWISEVGLAKLDGLDKLEELYLAGTLIGDEAMGELQRFPKLRKLRIAQTQVSSAGLEPLGKLDHLEELDLSEASQVFDDGLQHLSPITSLQKLNLWRVAVTDAGIAHLAPLVEMRWLNLDNTQLTDAGLPSLQGMTKLEFLHLGSTAVSDAGLKYLEPLTSLEELKVTRTAVTPAGVEELQKKLPDTDIQLKYLEGQ